MSEIQMHFFCNRNNIKPIIKKINLVIVIFICCSPPNIKIAQDFDWNTDIKSAVENYVQKYAYQEKVCNKFKIDTIKCTDMKGICIIFISAVYCDDVDYLMTIDIISKKVIRFQRTGGS